MACLDGLQIIRAAEAERPVIANLMQLYIHDFSELFAGTERGELEADGRFADYPLDSYWRESDQIPLLFRRQDRPIGFALLNTASHSGRPVDRNVAEFFVVRKHRRAGVGVAAVRAIFQAYPGVWEAAVARKNVGALAFWRRAVGNCPGVEDVEETDHSTAEWNGPILRFRVR